MWILLFAACQGGESPAGTLSGDLYAPPWASHLLYRGVDPDELAEGADTAAPLTHELHVGVSGAQQSWTLEFRDGENFATADIVMTWELSSASGIALTAIDGEALSPPVTLVEAAYALETPVSSGQWRTTPERLETFTTWYGTFEDVLAIQVDGPVVGEIYLAAEIGLVQFSWGDLAGDLAWYE